MAAGEADVVLSVRDLVVRFESADGVPVTVLSGASFDVLRGETLVIMGGRAAARARC